MTRAEAVRFRYLPGARALADILIEGLTRVRVDIDGVRSDEVRRLLGARRAGFADWCTPGNAQPFPRSGAGLLRQPRPPAALYLR